MAQDKRKHTLPPPKIQGELLLVFCSAAPVQNGFLTHSTGFLEVGVDLRISCMICLKYLSEPELSGGVQVTHYQAAGGGCAVRELPFSYHTALCIYVQRGLCFNEPGNGKRSLQGV